MSQPVSPTPASNSTVDPGIITTSAPVGTQPTGMVAGDTQSVSGKKDSDLDIVVNALVDELIRNKPVLELIQSKNYDALDELAAAFAAVFIAMQNATETAAQGLSDTQQLSNTNSEAIIKKTEAAIQKQLDSYHKWEAAQKKAHDPVMKAMMWLSIAIACVVLLVFCAPMISAAAVGLGAMMGIGAGGGAGAAAAGAGAGTAAATTTGFTCTNAAILVGGATVAAAPDLVIGLNKLELQKAYTELASAQEASGKAISEQEFQKALFEFLQKVCEFQTKVATEDASGGADAAKTYNEIIGSYKEIIQGASASQAV